MSEEQRAEKRHAHAVRETEFLRLKRSRLGVDDFDPLKVIGRGAFGEVRLVQGRLSEELTKVDKKKGTLVDIFFDFQKALQHLYHK